MAQKKLAVTKKKAVKKPDKAQKRRDLCFVIMPYGEWFDEYYSTVFVSAIESAGLEAHRADDLYRAGAIVNDIWEYTKSARVILADLTGKNPNVFYELGLAHAVAKPAVLVTASINDVPFDLRGLRIIEYDKNDPRWGLALQSDLQRALEETLQAPAASVLPTFLTKASGETPRVSEGDRALMSIKQDIEMLKRELPARAVRPRRSSSMDFDIGPDRARALIRELITSNASDDVIVAAVEPLGPPANWISDVIREIRGGVLDGATSRTT